MLRQYSFSGIPCHDSQLLKKLLGPQVAAIYLFAYEQKETTTEEQSVSDDGIVTKKTITQIDDGGPIKKTDSVIKTGHFAEDGKTFVCDFTSTEHKIETDKQIITKYGHIDDNGTEITDDVKVTRKVTQLAKVGDHSFKVHHLSKSDDNNKSTNDVQGPNFGTSSSADAQEIDPIKASNDDEYYNYSNPSYDNQDYNKSSYGDQDYSKSSFGDQDYSISDIDAEKVNHGKFSSYDDSDYSKYYFAHHDGHF